MSDKPQENEVSTVGSSQDPSANAAQVFTF